MHRDDHHTTPPHHPTPPPQHQADALQGVLSEVGWVQDIIVNRQTGHVIDGHLRIELARQRGESTVPVVYVDLSPEEEALVLATLDPLGALAEADQAKLEELLQSISTDSPAIRKMLDEMSGNLAGTGLPENPPEDPGAQVERVDELKQKWGTARGQVWEIASSTCPGKSHRLMCGDSTNLADVEHLMSGRKAALFATDPPYLVDYTGDDRPAPGKDWSTVYHEVEIKDGEAFFRNTFTNALAVLQDNAAWYCWHASRRASLIERIWEELGLLVHQQIVWRKPRANITYSFYPWQHEPCWMGWKKGNKPDHDSDFSHAHTSVWDIDFDGKSIPVDNDHPTQKPVELFAIPIRKHTGPGDICLELFSGSGSHFVAAEQCGRLCYGMEIEPGFVAVALERMAGMGLEPRLVSHGTIES